MIKVSSLLRGLHVGFGCMPSNSCPYGHLQRDSSPLHLWDSPGAFVYSLIQLVFVESIRTCLVVFQGLEIELPWRPDLVRLGIVTIGPFRCPNVMQTGCEEKGGLCNPSAEIPVHREGWRQRTPVG